MPDLLTGLALNGQQVTKTQTACRFTWGTKNPEIQFLGKNKKAENGMPDLLSGLPDVIPRTINAKTACRL